MNQLEIVDHASGGVGGVLASFTECFSSLIIPLNYWKTGIRILAGTGTGIPVGYYFEQLLQTTQILSLQWLPTSYPIQLISKEHAQDSILNYILFSTDLPKTGLRRFVRRFYFADEKLWAGRHLRVTAEINATEDALACNHGSDIVFDTHSKGFCWVSCYEGHLEGQQWTGAKSRASLVHKMWPWVVINWPVVVNSRQGKMVRGGGGTSGKFSELMKPFNLLVTSR